MAYSNSAFKVLLENFYFVFGKEKNSFLLFIEIEDLGNQYFKNLFETSNSCTLKNYLNVNTDIFATVELTDEHTVNKFKDNANKSTWKKPKKQL